MKRKSRRFLLAAALVILVLSWLVRAYSSPESLSSAGLVPMLVLLAVIFLLKAGLLTALSLLMNKLLEKLRKK